MFSSFHYLDAFLNDEVKSFAARCHKKPQEKIALPVQNGMDVHLVEVMLNSIDEEHYMLYPIRIRTIISIFL